LPARPPQEFRRYRRALLIIYLVLVSGIGVLLLASAAWGIWYVPSAPAGQAVIDPHNVADLLTCNQQLTQLAVDLQNKLCTVEEMADNDLPGYERSWADFISDWEQKWRDLGGRCRFDEHGSGYGVDFDHMALVHSDLWNLHLAYGDLARTFIENDADQASRIHRALEAARSDLEGRTPGSDAPNR
jgi:hypothetical protein